MSYVTDLKPRLGDGLAGIGRSLAAIGKSIWRAMMAAQQARARRMIELYHRDGVIR